MHYIYHIKNFIHSTGEIGKIGASTKPKFRVKQQGYTDYEILEEYECIYTTSKRELELQKQYGYPVDCIPYHISYQNLMKNWSIKKCSIANKSRKTMGHPTSHPIIVLRGSKIVAEYKSISECARDMELDKGNIHKTLKGIYKHHKGYTFNLK